MQSMIPPDYGIFDLGIGFPASKIFTYVLWYLLRRVFHELTTLMTTTCANNNKHNNYNTQNYNKLNNNKYHNNNKNDTKVSLTIIIVYAITRQIYVNDDNVCVIVIQMNRMIRKRLHSTRLFRPSGINGHLTTLSLLSFPFCTKSSRRPPHSQSHFMRSNLFIFFASVYLIHQTLFLPLISLL